MNDPAVRGDRLEVGHAGIAAVGEQQQIRQRRGIGEKRALGLRIGRDLHGHTSSANPLYVAWTSTAAGSIVVNRPGNVVRQRRLDGERRPVVNHDVREARDGPVWPSGVSVSSA